MDTMTEAAVLAAATVLAIGVAYGMAWAFLQGAFRLMQPAAVRTQVLATMGRQTANAGHAGSRLHLMPRTRAAVRDLGEVESSAL